MLTEEEYKEFTDTFVDVFEEDDEFDLDELDADYLIEGEDDNDFQDEDFEDDEDDFEDEEQEEDYDDEE